MKINKEELKTVIKSALKSAFKSNDLQSLWKQDQHERQGYQTYLDQHEDWRDAANAYRKDNGIPEGQDLFTDNSSHVKDHLDNTDPSTYTDDDWTALWGLSQHADNNVDLQKRTLGLIEEHKGKDWKINENTENSAYEYLSDRVAVNEGRDQQFNTQNEDV